MKFTFSKSLSNVSSIWKLKSSCTSFISSKLKIKKKKFAANFHDVRIKMRLAEKMSHSYDWHKFSKYSILSYRRVKCKFLLISMRLGAVKIRRPFWTKNSGARRIENPPFYVYKLGAAPFGRFAISSSTEFFYKLWEILLRNISEIWNQFWWD